MHTAHPHRLRLVRDAKGTHRVQFYIGQRRYRYAHGKAIGCPLRPNTHPEPTRTDVATELLIAFKAALDRGWRPDQEERPGCHAWLTAEA